MHELLDKGLSDNENEAYWLIRKWDSGSDNYSKYDTLYDAVLNGGSIDESMQELVAHGHTEKEVMSQLKSQIGTWYYDEKSKVRITKQQAIDMLKKYSTLSGEDITKTVNKWSSKLDMNGSHFYTVDYKSSTPLVYMKGEAPEICNGELEGSYDLADDEEGYEFFESESLIFPYGVNDAYIHHMELHNNWGYCICTGTETEKTSRYVGTATRCSPDNDIAFITDAIDIPEGYEYMTASGQIGYNRIISTKPVIYWFYSEDGTELRKSTSVPKARIVIPAGAKTVKIRTSLEDENFLAYNVYFTNYRENLTVSDCKFHNFHSLGLAGFEGPTKIVGCSFIESGKPRSDANGTSRATTGGVDIEDTPCPEFYMANCYSRDCAKLLMFGGYKGVVTNCIGDQIGAYRGWQLDISDCNISELYTMGAFIQLNVHDSFIHDRIAADEAPIASKTHINDSIAPACPGHHIRRNHEILSLSPPAPLPSLRRNADSDLPYCARWETALLRGMHRLQVVR